MTAFPARLHVLLAKDGSKGLVIRRGPAKSVCTVGWDLKTDQFVLGQWLRGRIYERRCDLSPDGKYFLYFAMNGHWDSEVKGSWSAISSYPYLKAIGLWSWGDCWNGGGLFLDARRYWLNGGLGRTALRLPSNLEQVPAHPFDSTHGNNECLGVYYPRLRRDGWSLLENARDGKDNVTTFGKVLRHGWTLRKVAHATSLHEKPGRGCYFDEHLLMNATGARVVSLPDWEWADYDGRRLLWAIGGELWAGAIGRDGLYDSTLLKDFNDMRFEAIQAPY